MVFQLLWKFTPDWYSSLLIIMVPELPTYSTMLRLYLWADNPETLHRKCICCTTSVFNMLLVLLYMLLICGMTRNKFPIDATFYRLSLIIKKGASWLKLPSSPRTSRSYTVFHPARRLELPTWYANEIALRSVTSTWNRDIHCSSCPHLNQP